MSRKTTHFYRSNGINLSTNVSAIAAPTAYGYPASHIPVLDWLSLSGTATANGAGCGSVRVSLAANALGTASATYSVVVPATVSTAASQVSLQPILFMPPGGLPLWAANAGVRDMLTAVTGISVYTAGAAAPVTAGSMDIEIGFHFENPAERAS